MPDVLVYKTYSEMKKIEDDYFSVTSKGKVGLIKRNIELIPCVLDDIRYIMSDQFAVVIKDGLEGVYDFVNKCFVLPCSYTGIAFNNLEILTLYKAEKDDSRSEALFNLNTGKIITGFYPYGRASFTFDDDAKLIIQKDLNMSKQNYSLLNYDGEFLVNSADSVEVLNNYNDYYKFTKNGAINLLNKNTKEVVFDVKIGEVNELINLQNLLILTTGRFFQVCNTLNNKIYGFANNYEMSRRIVTEDKKGIVVFYQKNKDYYEVTDGNECIVCPNLLNVSSTGRIVEVLEDDSIGYHQGVTDKLVENKNHVFVLGITKGLYLFKSKDSNEYILFNTEFDSLTSLGLFEDNNVGMYPLGNDVFVIKSDIGMKFYSKNKDSMIYESLSNDYMALNEFNEFYKNEYSDEEYDMIDSLYFINNGDINNSCLCTNTENHFDGLGDLCFSAGRYVVVNTSRESLSTQLISTNGSEVRAKDASLRIIDAVTGNDVFGILFKSVRITNEMIAVLESDDQSLLVSLYPLHILRSGCSYINMVSNTDAHCFYNEGNAELVNIPSLLEEPISMAVMETVTDEKLSNMFSVGDVYYENKSDSDEHLRRSLHKVEIEG